MRKLPEERIRYPFILGLMLILHGTLMFLTFKATQRRDFQRDKKVLVIKLNHQINNQIVRSEDSDLRELKDKAYLSHKTRSFERQSRAQTTAPFREARRARGERSTGRKNLKFSDLGKEVAGDPLRQAANNYRKRRPGDGGAHSSFSPGSTNDYLQHIPLGDLTHLNTVEYKYYGFYFRIRQKLEQFWGRSLSTKARELAQKGRAVATNAHFITALIIVLDNQGKILTIKLKGSSGVKELDDAAVESFNEAGPFPNPPKGLIVDGKVTLEWGFVVES